VLALAAIGAGCSHSTQPAPANPEPAERSCERGDAPSCERRCDKYDRAKEFDRSIAACERAVELAGTAGPSTATLLRLAHGYLHRRQWANARLVAQRVLDRQPHDAPAHLLIADAYCRERELGRAVEYYRKASMKAHGSDHQFVRRARARLERVAAWVRATPRSPPPSNLCAHEALYPDEEAVTSEAVAERAESRRSPRGDEIAARVRDAARGCRDELAAASGDVSAVQRCVCDRLASRPLSPASASTVVSWPMPGTTSGSTDTADGLRLVPLGAVFEISIDASGAVERCGVQSRP